MSPRRRYRVMLVVCALVGLAYGEASSGWDRVAFYAGLSGTVAVVVLVGLFWTEMGPDGVSGRRRHRG